jgi:hypothetical protein
MGTAALMLCMYSKADQAVPEVGAPRPNGTEAGTVIFLH